MVFRFSRTDWRRKRSAGSSESPAQKFVHRGGHTGLRQNNRCLIGALCVDHIALPIFARLPLIASPDASTGGIRLNPCAGWVGVNGELRSYGGGDCRPLPQGFTRCSAFNGHSLNYLARDRRRAERQFHGSRGADVSRNSPPVQYHYHYHWSAPFLPCLESAQNLGSASCKRTHSLKLLCPA